MAMQVPVVMTSLGQKITMQQPTGTTVAPGPTTLLTSASSIAATASPNSQQKVCKCGQEASLLQQAENIGSFIFCLQGPGSQSILVKNLS